MPTYLQHLAGRFQKATKFLQKERGQYCRKETMSSIIQPRQGFSSCNWLCTCGIACRHKQLRLLGPLQVVNRDISIAVLRYFVQQRQLETKNGTAAKSKNRVRGGVTANAATEEDKVCWIHTSARSMPASQCSISSAPCKAPWFPHTCATMHCNCHMVSTSSQLCGKPAYACQSAVESHSNNNGMPDCMCMKANGHIVPNASVT